MNAVAPCTEAEVARLVRRGEPSAARLCTQALTGIVHYDPDDFVVTVRAGTPMSALTSELANHGQRVAFEAPHHHGVFGDRSATTAGALAAGALCGPRRMAGGSARDHILGLRLVNGLGDVIQCGGRSLKNVAGLDLTRLVVGSRGSLGLITEVSFRLEAVPAASHTMAWPGPPGHLLRSLARARAGGLQPALGVHACARTAQAVGAAAPPEGLNLVRFDGRPVAVQANAARFAALLEGAAVDISSRDAAPWWSGLRDLDAFGALAAHRVWQLPLFDDDTLARLGRLAALPQARLQLDGWGRRAWLALPTPAAEDLADLAGRPPPRIAELTRALRHSFDPCSLFATDD